MSRRRGRAQQLEGGRDSEALSRARAHIEEVLGYHFDDPVLLAEALTHSSWVNEHPGEGQHNERLEFLGDAALQLVVTDLLFKNLPEAREGQLSTLRTQLVRADRLEEFGRRLNLADHLIVGGSVRVQPGGSRTSVLGDAFEALLGAVYRDGGYPEVFRVVETLLGEEVERAARGGAVAYVRDPKTELQEYLQKNKAVDPPRYTSRKVGGTDHDPEFEAQVLSLGTVLGTGRARNKKEAEKAAAAAALAAIKSELEEHPDDSHGWGELA